VTSEQNRPQRAARAVLVVGAAALTCDDIAAAAYGQRSVELAEGVLDRVAAAHERAVRLVTSRHVYGRTTGVGANRHVTVEDGGDAHVAALLRSHATAAGERRSDERVRGMLVVRLHQLGAGASGLRPDVVRALHAMVRADALPEVRELGGIGTGDLPALAAAALALAGERPTSRPLPSTVPFGVHDALPFLSSGAATIADSAIAQQSLLRQGRATVVVAALTFAAVRGNPEAFSVPVERAAPFAGTRQVCRWMRRLVDPQGVGERIQDPYGLRALPQVQGSLLDVLEHLATVVEGHASSAGENPMVVLPDEPGSAPDPATDVPHNGAFHLAPLATALDTARSAVLQSAQLVQRRLALLIDPAYTSLAPFLSDGTAGSSGVMPLEYVAASALAGLRVLATGVATGTTTLSRGAEDDASFASTAARLALDVDEPLRVLLACELVAAVRALRQRSARGAAAPSPILDQVLDVCAPLPDDVRDRDLSGDLDVAARLLDELADLLPADAPAAAGTLDAT
jgi:histidine ammonia-lyase